MSLQKYMPFASRSQECALLMPDGDAPSISAAPVYLATEVDAELVSLRERVAELEKELQRTDAAYLADKTALREASNSLLKEAEDRENLLLETVRWLHSELQDCESCRSHQPATIPTHLAPLIAEAVKQEQSNG